MVDADVRSLRTDHEPTSIQRSEAPTLHILSTEASSIYASSGRLRHYPPPCRIQDTTNRSTDYVPDNDTAMQTLQNMTMQTLQDTPKRNKRTSNAAVICNLHVHPPHNFPDNLHTSYPGLWSTLATFDTAVFGAGGKSSISQAPSNSADSRQYPHHLCPYTIS